MSFHGSSYGSTKSLTRSRSSAKAEVLRLTSTDEKESRQWSGKEPFIMQKPIIGENFPTVRFRTQYNSEEEKLMVDLLDAEHLNQLVENGKTHPYLKVYLEPGKDGEKQTINDDPTYNPNPTYNKKFEFTVPNEDYNKNELCLVIQVFNNNYVKNELLGVTQVYLSHLRQEEGQWAEQETGHKLMVLRTKDGIVPKSEEARMRRKILQQEDELHQLEEANNVIRTNIANKKKHKEEVAREITELEKKKANLALLEQKARNGETVELPDIEGEVELEVGRYRTELEEKSKEAEKLEKKVAELLSSIISKSKNGSLKVGLAHYPESDSLIVEVVSAKKIAAINIQNTKSDPYIKVSLSIPGQATSDLGKTRTIWKNLNPTWEEDLPSPDGVVITREDVKNCSIELVMKDDAKVGAKTPMGKVVINANSSQGAWHLDQVANKSGNKIYMEYPIQL